MTNQASNDKRLEPAAEERLLNDEPLKFGNYTGLISLGHYEIQQECVTQHTLCFGQHAPQYA